MNKENITDGTNLDEQSINLYKSMAILLGQYFHKVRLEQDISCRELYKKTSISIAVISDFENGLKIPRFETLVKLALALNVPLENVFGNKINSFYKDKKFVEINNEKVTESFFIERCLNIAGFNKQETKSILDYIDFVQHKRKSNITKAERYRQMA